MGNASSRLLGHVKPHLRGGGDFSFCRSQAREKFDRRLMDGREEAGFSDGEDRGGHLDLEYPFLSLYMIIKRLLHRKATRHQQCKLSVLARRHKSQTYNLLSRCTKGVRGARARFLISRRRTNSTA
jgi:hypothetical protein